MDLSGKTLIRQAAARCCAQACEGIVDVIQGRIPKWPATFRNGH